MKPAFAFGFCPDGGGGGGSSVAVSASSATPTYGDSVTITATPTGIIPTLYTYYANGTQIGSSASNSLSWIVSTVGSTEITVQATAVGSSAVGSTTISVSYTRRTSIYTDGVNDTVRGWWKIGAAQGRALSASFWIKYISGTAFFIRIGEPVDGQNYIFLIQPSSTGPALNFRIGAGPGFYPHSQSVLANTWIHVVLTYRVSGYSTANPMAIYINGASAYSNSSPTGRTQIVKPSIQLQLPDFGGATSIKFHGLSLYEECISAAQAATLYNGGTPLAVPSLAGVTMTDYFGGAEVAQVPSTNTSLPWTEVNGVNGGKIYCNNSFASPYGLVTDIP